VGKKRQGPEAAERHGSRPIPLLVAYGFGLLCGVGGILTLIFGAGHAGQDAGVEGGDVAALGYMLIGMGLAAAVLTAVIQWTKR